MAGMAAVLATPQHLGMFTGEFFPMGLNAEMPGDQRFDDGLSLCFDGDLLSAPLDLLGAAKLTLRLSSDAPLGFVVARLCDVAPDGSSVRIAHGMLNLCHRDSMENPAPMVPGQEVEVSFYIDQMAYRLSAGHRLRLALSNSYWPFLWPSPEAGRLTLVAGRLDLPVHQGSGTEWVPPEAEGAKPWAHRVIRKGRAERRIETDLLSGKRVLHVVEDGGEVENLTHGLCTSESLTERWEIMPDDPLSARVHHLWEQAHARGAWRIKTRAEAEMTATATHFVIKARLTAWESDVILFDKEFADQVPRRFV